MRQLELLSLGLLPLAGLLALLALITSPARGLPVVVDTALGQEDIKIDGPFRTGRDIATGDFNGDGIDDLLVGGDGDSYIVFGSPALFGLLDMTAGDADVTIAGAFGWAVDAGDFNGDGFDDAVVENIWADGPGGSRPDAGEAYVVLGGATMPATVDISLGQQHVTILGAEAGDNLGKALGVGDVNGDGIDDILVGAPADGPGNARVDAGEVYVIFGSPGLSGTIDTAAGGQDVTIFYAEAGDAAYFWNNLVAAGDANGDGVEDILLGASRADGPANGRDAAGEAYVIFGSPALGGTLDLAAGAQNLTILGANAGDNLGEAIAAGDVNGDGTDDVLVGAPGMADDAYVLFGSASLGGTRDVLLGQQNVTVVGASQLGWSVASTDLNSDGVDDILAGAMNELRGLPASQIYGAGKAYALLGSPTLAGTKDVSLSDQAMTIVGAEDGTILTADFLGLAVATGDVNGDGAGDFIAGAPSFDSDAGVYVVFGDPTATPTPTPTVTPTPTPTITPTPTATATPVPTGPSILGYWKFDEGAGTAAADSSGRGNHGTLINDPVWTTGISGTALQLDGLNDYVRVPDAPSLDISGPYTVMAWVNPDSSVGCYESFINKYLNYALQTCATDRLRLISSGVGSLESPDFTLLPNVWQHVAGTWDGATMRLYHEGTLVASANLGPMTPTASNNPLTFGVELLGGGSPWEFFGGMIDEIKVYNRALSDAEIAAAGRPPGPQPAIFSVRPPDVVGPACTAAGLLTLPGLSGVACARPPVAPNVVLAPALLGLDLAGADDLDAISLSELRDTDVPGFHFSVDAASTGAGGCVAPDVASEAAGGQAHGDIFTDVNVSGCNKRFQDELSQGLNAPGLPSDDMDALTEPPAVTGPCNVPPLGAIPCPLFSLAAGSATLAATGAKPADLLVPPGAPGCGGPLPCLAVAATALGLDGAGASSDDLDALCWFDLNINGLPELPLAAGGPDQYYFSLAIGSATLAGLGLSAADILAPTAQGVAPAVAAARLGLATTDNLDALKCLDPDSDADGIRDAFDNCPLTATRWWVPPGDDDCDGWTTADETFIGTDPDLMCGSDWPANINNTALLSINKVDIYDINALAPPVFFSTPSNPNYSVRKDIAPSNKIDIFDVNKMAPPVFFATCTP